MAGRVTTGLAASGGAVLGILVGGTLAYATAPDWDGYTGSRREFDKQVRSRMSTGALIGVVVGSFAFASLASPEEASAATKPNTVGSNAPNGLPPAQPMPGS